MLLLHRQFRPATAESKLSTNQIQGPGLDPNLGPKLGAATLTHRSKDPDPNFPGKLFRGRKIPVLFSKPIFLFPIPKLVFEKAWKFGSKRVFPYVQTRCT